MEEIKDIKKNISWKGVLLSIVSILGWFVAVTLSGMIAIYLEGEMLHELSEFVTPIVLTIYTIIIILASKSRKEITNSFKLNKISIKSIVIFGFLASALQVMGYLTSGISTPAQLLENATLGFPDIGTIAFNMLYTIIITLSSTIVLKHLVLDKFNLKWLYIIGIFVINAALYVNPIISLEGYGLVHLTLYGLSGIATAVSYIKSESAITTLIVGCIAQLILLLIL